MLAKMTSTGRLLAEGAAPVPGACKLHALHVLPFPMQNQRAAAAARATLHLQTP